MAHEAKTGGTRKVALVEKSVAKLKVGVDVLRLHLCRAAKEGDCGSLLAVQQAHAANEVEHVGGLNEQIAVARIEADNRFPTVARNEAKWDEAVSAGSWNEERRLKRLLRSMKIKIAEPLVPSDYCLPEGLLLACGGPAMGVTKLCSTLADDFGVTHLVGGPADGPEADGRVPLGAGTGDDPAGACYRELHEKLGCVVMLQNWLKPATALEQLDSLSSRLELMHTRPSAVLLFLCDEITLAARILAAAKERGEPGTDSAEARHRAEARASDWVKSELPAIGAAAREAKLPVIRVYVDGSFEQQMSSLLVAISSI